MWINQKKKKEAKNKSNKNNWNSEIWGETQLMLTLLLTMDVVFIVAVHVDCLTASLSFFSCFCAYLQHNILSHSLIHLFIRSYCSKMMCICTLSRYCQIVANNTSVVWWSCGMEWFAYMFAHLLCMCLKWKKSEKIKIVFIIIAAAVAACCHYCSCCSYCWYMLLFYNVASYVAINLCLHAN